jgi:predicted glycogen debranching enzyme
MERARWSGARGKLHPNTMKNIPKESEINNPEGFPAAVEFGRDVCGTLETAEKLEWIVTNGIGGFASGTVSGNLTRRYHGLLIAALQPPVGRTLLCATLDEAAHYDGAIHDLSANRWVGGEVSPKGFVNIESFRLEGTTPVWQFAFGDALLEKRIWMKDGENTTHVQYTLLRASGALTLDLKPYVNYRDFHSSTHAGDWRMRIDRVERGVQVTAFDGAVPFYILNENATTEIHHEWCRDYFLPEERNRGLDDHEDHLLAAVFHTELQLNQSAVFIFATRPDTDLDGARTWNEHAARERELLAIWAAADPVAARLAPDWIQQLVLAADQFIVQRSLPQDADGRSIIAGYHWFGDWGRDTMISLPGLALTTGRPEIARKILLSSALYMDQGMLPNNFPDANGRPEYNAVDAALWYVEAVRQYFAVTQDEAALRTVFPVLEMIINSYSQGTRYQIHVDPADGLLYAGEAGVQLTWMDAKVGDWVVTPRIGKPVEVNALWYNALETMAALSPKVGKPAEPFAKMASAAKRSFVKFWNEQRGCCFDVIDSPGIRNDTALRPNQIFAVSLPMSPLSPDQQKAIVDICARRLLTSHGLRSLAPGEPDYQPHYGGGMKERDSAYHRGTVWGWLIGPFVHAHLRVYGDRDAALSFLEPLGRQIRSSGLGTLSEIFEGDAPFAARGCIAQAWSVAEVLRAWRAAVV